MKNLTFQPIVLLRTGIRVLIELFIAWQLAQMFFHNRSHLAIFPVPAGGSMFEPAGWGWPQEFRTYIVTYIGKGAVANQAVFARSYPIKWQALGSDLLVYLILGVSIFWLLSRLPFLRKRLYRLP